MKIPQSIVRGAAAVVGASVILSAAACSSSPSGSAAAVSYAPAAYGIQAGKAFDCYYIESPLEAATLINEGLCPRGSIATLMPLTWEETYWSYYDSTAYYDTYMPVSYRTKFTSVYVVHFRTTYSSQITTYSSKGTYKSSTGKTVTGTSASKLKFGTSSSGSTGSARTVHGGGSGTVSSCSMSMTILSDKSGGSTVHGGGSGSSSRSGSSSKSGSGSRGGC